MRSHIAKIVLVIFSLTLFSSCGFIRIDTSAAADQFTDFSPNEPRKPSEDLANDGHFGPYPQLPPADCGCVEKPKYNRPPCPMIYVPVCGCDGITYRNPCEAGRAGIIKFTRGKCHQDEFCPYIYAPVCGYNGITYSNECLARRAGIKYFRKGKCSTIHDSHDAIGL